MGKENIKSIIPIEGNYSDMTPTDFEAHTRALFKLQRNKKKSIIKDYSVQYSKTKTTPNGHLQIQGKIKYSFLLIDYLVLIESKHYMGPIKRKQIWELKEKMKKAGAQKGIFVTTSYYQFGAIKYAKEHEILLLSIVNADMQYKIRNDEIKKRYYSDPQKINIKSHRTARIMLESDTEASITYFEDKRQLLFFLIGNNK